MMTSLDSGYSTLKTGTQDILPTAITILLTTAEEITITAISSLDTPASSGLDIMTDKLPEKPMPNFYQIGKDTVSSYMGAVAIYLTNSTMVLQVLKAAKG